MFLFYVTLFHLQPSLSCFLLFLQFFFYSKSSSFGGNSLKVMFSVSELTADTLSISWKTVVSVEVIVQNHVRPFAGLLSVPCFNSHPVSPPSPLSTLQNTKL